MTILTIVGTILLFVFMLAALTCTKDDKKPIPWVDTPEVDTTEEPKGDDKCN